MTKNSQLVLTIAFNVENDSLSIFVIFVIFMMMRWKGKRYSTVKAVAYAEWVDKSTFGIAKDANSV